MLNAPTDHWEIPNNGRVVLQIINEHSTDDGVFTVETPGELIAGLSYPDWSATIEADDESELVGPFPVNVFGATLRITATSAGDLRLLAWRI